MEPNQPAAELDRALEQSRIGGQRNPRAWDLELLEEAGRVRRRCEERVAVRHQILGLDDALQSGADVVEQSRRDVRARARWVAPQGYDVLAAERAPEVVAIRDEMRDGGRLSASYKAREETRQEELLCAERVPQGRPEEISQAVVGQAVVSIKGAISGSHNNRNRRVFFEIGNAGKPAASGDRRVLLGHFPIASLMEQARTFFAIRRRQFSPPSV